MNDTTCKKLPTDSYWSQLLLMAILAVGIFISIEYIPTILNGVAGAIAGLIAASVCLYSFGRVVGQMIGNESVSKTNPDN